LTYDCFGHSLYRAGKGLSNGMKKACIHKNMSKLEPKNGQKTVISGEAMKGRVCYFWFFFSSHPD
jgi:hypothetical protein